MDKNQDQVIVDERRSLHDLANALTIAQGKLMLLMRGLNQDPSAISAEELSEKLDQVLISINRMADLIHARREKISR